MVNRRVDTVTSAVPGPYASRHKATVSFYVFFLISSLAIIMCIFFEAEQPFPLSVSLTLFAGIVIWGLWKVKLSKYSILTRTMIILYSLPFIHCFQHLWHERIVYSDRIWGLAPNPYQMDLEIIKRTAMVGCIGAFGLVAGYFSAELKRQKKTKMLFYVSKSLDRPWFIFIAAISIFFSWIHAPKETILFAAYTTSENWLHGINFNAAGILSYIFATLLLVDMFNERVPQIRKFKRAVTLGVFVIIVFWLQFMRGDRECAGMIVGFIVLYFLNQSNRFRFNKKRFVAVIILIVIFFFMAQVVGQVRSSSFITHQITMPDKFNIISGTWSAALLTPLSVVGDFYYNLMEPRWGKTYWDYFLSLPPGILTQLIGIERPIEKTHCPGREMQYGIGGTHAMVVPFMNFKTFGVFFMLLIYGFFIGKLEMKMQDINSIKIWLLYGSFFVFAFRWFWYGEMYLIRGIMAFYVVWLSYRLLPKLSYRPRSEHSRRDQKWVNNTH